MKPKAIRFTVDDYIRANRVASRQEEISMFGKQIFARHMVHKSKKTYDRKKKKREDRDVLSFCFEAFDIFFYVMTIVL